MVFHWSWSDRKSLQVSRTRLRILAVLSNAVIWIVSTHPPTSKSSRPFNNPFVIVPKAPITIGTIVTFMFHRFFNSLARSRNLSFFSHSLTPDTLFYHIQNIFLEKILASCKKCGLCILDSVDRAWIYSTSRSQTGCDTKLFPRVDYCWFKLRVFHLLDWLPNQG